MSLIKACKNAGSLLFAVSSDVQRSFYFFSDVGIQQGRVSHQSYADIVFLYPVPKKMTNKNNENTVRVISQEIALLRSKVHQIRNFFRSPLEIVDAKGVYGHTLYSNFQTPPQNLHNTYFQGSGVLLTCSSLWYPSKCPLAKARSPPLFAFFLPKAAYRRFPSMMMAMCLGIGPHFMKQTIKTLNTWTIHLNKKNDFTWSTHDDNNNNIDLRLQKLTTCKHFLHATIASFSVSVPVLLLQVWKASSRSRGGPWSL